MVVRTKVAFKSTVPEYESRELSNPLPPEQPPADPAMLRPVELELYSRFAPPYQTRIEEPPVGLVVGMAVGVDGRGVLIGAIVGAADIEGAADGNGVPRKSSCP